MTGPRLAAVVLAIAFLLLVALAGIACCGLLPERLAVRGPIWHQMTGLGGGHADRTSLAGFRVPEGFGVQRFASGISNARLLHVTAGGDLLVSSPRAGEVLLVLRDDDGDGRSDGTQTLLDGLDRPHGLDLHQGWLYVAESGGVGRIRFDAGARAVRGPYTRVIDDLPAGGNHWTRTVGFGPDGWMYVSVGSSCNVCEEEDPRRAALLRYRPDGSGGEIHASGLRNAVGFDWRPADGALYATDNGRDLLGDDFPPCELNRVEAGAFYGWPYANGDRVPDPDLGEDHPEQVSRSVPPVHGFRAHNAPLGIRFIEGEGLPATYRGAALVALHGSWNRTRLDGYKVVSLHWGADGEIEERDFLTGFLRDGEVVGRPVDVAEGPDGALYVSDDYGGGIYRVVYGESGGSAAALAPAAPATRPIGTAPSPELEAAAPATRPIGTAPSPELEAAARRGHALYDAHACAGCHEAAQAEPGVVVRPLRDLSARYELDALTAFLAAPTPPMPALDLSAAARRDLAAYLLERHP